MQRRKKVKALVAVVVYDGEKQWRMGVVVPIHASMYRFWKTEQERFIAQLELLMVVVALWHLAPLLQGSIITWYIDNTAAHVLDQRQE